MPTDRPFLHTPLGWLRYAVVWGAYAWLRALVLLPFAWQLWLGKRFGAAAWHIMRGRRRVAERNVEVCLPELSAAARKQLVRDHFEALGASVAEMAMGWHGPLQAIQSRVRIEGEENLRAALDKGKGVILFSAHLTCFEFLFPALAPLCPRLTGMYKPQRNPAMNLLMRRGRARSVDEQFTKDNVRAMLKNLARNAVVWYASDQSYGRKGSTLIPFFNEPAMTNTAISRIARRSGAVVLPYFFRRLPGDAAYVINIGAPLDDFPSEDSVRDVRRLTAQLEDYIRLCPEQYWWIHKRFKGRPEPYPNIYAAMKTSA